MAKRETLNKRDKEKRCKALHDLENLSVILRRGGCRMARAALSPARALTELRRTDVGELLGWNETSKYRKAAELLL